MKIENTKNQELKKIKGLVYGVSGIGKTFSTTTLTGKTLVIAVEKGLLTLQDYNIDFVNLENWEELLDIYMELNTNENIEKYDNIVIDSLTKANEMCKIHILFKERPKVKGDVNKTYEDVLTLQDYGLLQIKMVRMINSFINLPYNIIFTSLEDERKDEKDGHIYYVPSLNGKLAKNVVADFDFTFRMVSKTIDNKTERYFLTENTETSLAKDRIGKLDRLEEPNWTNVINKSLGIVEEKKETKKKESK